MTTDASGATGIGPVVTVVLGLLALIVIVAVAVAYFRATYVKATIETLKASNEAYSERVDQLEADALSCKTRLTSVEQENTNLRSYVAGTDAIKELASTMRSQHGEMMARMGEVIEQSAAHMILEHPRRQATRRTPAKKATTPRRAR